VVETPEAPNIPEGLEIGRVPKVMFYREGLE
jgi:hypothetical protein